MELQIIFCVYFKASGWKIREFNKTVIFYFFYFAKISSGFLKTMKNAFLISFFLFSRRGFITFFILVFVRTVTKLVPGEPNGPLVKTPIPGPRSQALLEELNSYQVCSIVELSQFKLVSLPVIIYYASMAVFFP